MCGVTCSYIYGEGEANVRADYYPVKKVPFEGKLYNAPSNYDAYLTQIYGDYMTIPKKEDQNKHNTSVIGDDDNEEV